MLRSCNKKLQSLAAVRTGVSDCAGFAPNRKQKAVWHSPRFPSRPATLLRAPFRPFARVALFFLAAAQVKEKTSRHRQKGKIIEIRRNHQQNHRAIHLSSVPSGLGRKSGVDAGFARAE